MSIFASCRVEEIDFERRALKPKSETKYDVGILVSALARRKNRTSCERAPAEESDIAKTSPLMPNRGESFESKLVRTTASAVHINGNTVMKEAGIAGRVLVIDDERRWAAPYNACWVISTNCVVMTGGSEAIELLVAGKAKIRSHPLRSDDARLSGHGRLHAKCGGASRARGSLRLHDRRHLRPRTRDFLESGSDDRLEQPFDLQTVRNLARSRVARASGCGLTVSNAGA